MYVNSRIASTIDESSMILAFHSDLPIMDSILVGQEPKKAQTQGEPLKSRTTNISARRERQSLSHVVCGATNHKNGFIFSDFIGF
jgi:hypothetical protein